MVGFLVVEGGAVFHERAHLPDRVVHAEAVHQEEVRGKQRLAHVEARVGVALDEEDREPLPREQRGGDGPARAAADDEHVAALHRPSRTEAGVAARDGAAAGPAAIGGSGAPAGAPASGSGPAAARRSWE